MGCAMAWCLFSRTREVRRAGMRSDLRNVTNPEKSDFCDTGEERKYHKSFEICILFKKQLV